MTQSLYRNRYRSFSLDDLLTFEKSYFAANLKKIINIGEVGSSMYENQKGKKSLH